jgi:AbrB family looped-hinge helix DNA binding protein
MICETKISRGFQTVVPSEIRKKMGIGPTDIVKWKLDNDKITVEFRKEPTFEDICGMIDTDVRTDAVQLKKMVQRGEKITPKRLKEVFSVQEGSKDNAAELKKRIGKG